MRTEYCVCCGEEIPEGCQVCITCVQDSEFKEIYPYTVKKKQKHNVFTLVGILLVVLALLLTTYNLLKDYRGRIRAAQSAEQLAQDIGRMRQVTERPNVSEPQTNDYDLRGSRLPDYVLNPDLPMPEIEADGGVYIGLLKIEALSLELPVSSKLSMEALNNSPARYCGSAYKNNMVIGAHNYYSHFGRLKDLAQGDIVTFTDMNGNCFRYRVTEIDILSAADVAEMTSGEWALTLFTCTVGGASRVAVRCERT